MWWLSREVEDFYMTVGQICTFSGLVTIQACLLYAALGNAEPIIIDLLVVFSFLLSLVALLCVISLHYKSRFFYDVVHWDRNS